MNVLLTNELHMQTVRQDHNRTIEALICRRQLMEQSSAARRAAQRKLPRAALPAAPSATSGFHGARRSYRRRANSNILTGAVN